MMMTNLTPLTLDSTVVASKQQISSELSDEVVILNLHRGVYHGLNATGTRIWQLIQQPRMVSEIRDTLLREFDVDAGRCEQHLVALLGELAGKGLVEIVPSPVG